MFRIIILPRESPQIVGTTTGKVTNDQMVYTINLNGNISKAAFVFSYGTGDAIYCDMLIDTDPALYGVHEIPLLTSGKII